MSEPRNVRYQRTRGLAVIAALGLAVALTACGGPSSPGDTTDPLVHVTSPASSGSASYELTGVAFDNVAVDAMTYSLDGGDDQSLAFADGAFSVTVTLAPGANDITVTATDAAGNVGSDSLTVTYEAPPSGASSSVDIAARGDSVTVRGSNFGDSGTVMVGGVEAAIDSWSDSEVTFTVPAEAPGGPQEVTIESSAGSTGLDLFVGVDFEAGTLEELAALDLPPGTAVRLGAGTFGQSTPDVLLEGLSLYGQGVGETIVDSGSAPQVLRLHVGSGQDLVFDGLELHVDVFMISSAEPGSVTAAGTGGIDFEALMQEAAEQAASAGELQVMAADTGSFTMSNMLIEENSGGGGVMTVDLGTISIFQGSVVMDNVEFDAIDSFLALMAFGDITVKDSAIDNGGVIFASFGGGVRVTGSTVEDTGAAGGLFGVSGVLSSEGIEIHDSEITSYANYEYYLAPVELVMGGGSPFVNVGSVNITDSSLKLLTTDPAAYADAGSLVLVGGFGSNTVSGNTFVAHRSIVLSEYGGSLDVDGNDFRIGHSGVAYSPLAFGQMAPLASFVDFRNNDVEWQALGGVMVEAQNGIAIDGNTFVGGGGVAVSLEEGGSPTDLDTTVTGNVFTGFDAALDIELDGASGTYGAITVTGNDFDFTMDALGEVAVLTDVVNPELDLNGNRWGGETDVAALNALIERLGETPPDMGEISSVIP